MEYQRCSLDHGLEPLLFYRDFYGVRKDYVEILQEFILLNNMYLDEKAHKYYALYEDGNSEEAIRINNGVIKIKTKFLIRYAAAKQKCILLFFDIRSRIDGTLDSLDLKDFKDEYRDKELFYGIWGGEMNSLNRYVFSVLMGKKIIYPLPMEECGIYPYEKARTYTTFIIGADEIGNPIEYSNNPDLLDNYFDANPGAPHYLTPVFFKKEVLKKYIDAPELYEVRDGYLDCQHLWGMEIDNHHRDCVSAYLGDLGRDLPESEQLHWKSYNIVGEERLSEVAIKRDFLGVSAESNMADHQFIYKFNHLSNLWKEKYGWDLFIPLSEKDQYIMKQIQIPVLNNQKEFDQLVQYLVKVIIDSINEKELDKEIDKKENEKGISKLQSWIETKGKSNYEEHIDFLKKLQKLRSTGSGHRKGKEYEKIAEYFGLSNNDFITTFEMILVKTNNFLDYLKQAFLPEVDKER